MLSERMTPMAGCSEDRPKPRKVTLASWRMAWGNWRMSPVRNWGSRWGRRCRRTICPRGQIVRRHLLPHLLPQFLTGLILQFPHAILHEASVTFLGFGLSSEQPAIGVILSESMQYLTTGRWWLALFPGLALVGVVLLFAALGEQVRRVLDPSSVHQ